MRFVVHIDEIRDSGLDYERELPHDFLAESLGGPDAPYQALGTGKFKAHFQKVPGRVIMTSRIELAVQAPCKRCLADVVRKSPVDVNLTWVSANEREDLRRAMAEAGIEGTDEIATEDDEPGSNNASFKDGDVDTEPFDGHKIPLDEMLREQILLSLPMDVLCKHDCAGLCTVCGQDLNERECGHDRRPPDPRWAALKDLKLPN